MTMFKKYRGSAWCIATEQADLNHGDEITVTTRRGKEIDCLIWKHLFSRDGTSYYSYVRQDGVNRSEIMRRKAERREQWAGSQNTRAHEYYERSNKDKDFLSLGEPIKVGHHSEARHRKMFEQADNNMRRSVEAAKKAQGHADKAETIAARAEREINLDSPDSLTALTERVAVLEKQREEIKAHNKANPEDKTPRYMLSNLGANIRRYKKRLETAENLWAV